MKYIARFFPLIVLFLICSAFTRGDTSSIEGKWFGEFTAIDHAVPFKVHFWLNNDELKGTISLSGEGSKELPLSWVMFDASTIHFELVQPSKTLVFDGVLQNGKISGDLLFSNVRGKFQLTSQKLVSL